MGSPPPSHAASGDDQISADLASRCLVGAARQRVQLLRKIGTLELQERKPLFFSVAGIVFVAQSSFRVVIMVAASLPVPSIFLPSVRRVEALSILATSAFQLKNSQPS